MWVHRARFATTRRAGPEQPWRDGRFWPDAASLVLEDLDLGRNADRGRLLPVPLAHHDADGGLADRIGGWRAPWVLAELVQHGRVVGERHTDLAAIARQDFRRPGREGEEQGD